MMTNSKSREQEHCLTSNSTKKVENEGKPEAVGYIYQGWICCRGGEDDRILEQEYSLTSNSTKKVENEGKPEAVGYIYQGWICCRGGEDDRILEQEYLDIASGKEPPAGYSYTHEWVCFSDNNPFGKVLSRAAAYIQCLPSSMKNLCNFNKEKDDSTPYHSVASTPYSSVISLVDDTSIITEQPLKGAGGKSLTPEENNLLNSDHPLSTPYASAISLETTPSIYGSATSVENKKPSTCFTGFTFFQALGQNNCAACIT